MTHKQALDTLMYGHNISKEEKNHCYELLLELIGFHHNVQFALKQLDKWEEER